MNLLFFISSAEAAPQIAINTNPLAAIFQASLIVQVTFLILILLSVFCWGIGIAKFRQFQRIRTKNEIFLSKFWKVSSLDNLYEEFEQYKDSPVARVFKAAYLEMKKLAESPLAQRSSQDSTAKPQLQGIDNLERVLRKSTENEIALMESKLTVLATTGSTGPFIGLFGTVWGIMGSFHKIGAMGSASLAVVAPGISEALFATAIGLAAAIPAVVLYNNFISHLRRQEIELNNFSSDFLNIVKRNFFQGN
ncbi:MAG: protein TolQ [Bdellovibrionota bacterium]